MIARDRRVGNRMTGLFSRLACVLSVIPLSFHCKTITLEETRAKLENGIKRGDAEEKIRLFLKENNIEANGPAWPYKKGKGFDSMDQRWKERDQFPITYFFDGAIHRASGSFWVSCGHYMRFYFNSERKLEGYVLDKICTGP